jgi:hypothetical protein
MRRVLFVTGRKRFTSWKAVVWIALFLLIPAVACQAEVLRTLSGYVQTVDIQKKTLTLFFKNPATGTDEVLVFGVSENTGFGKKNKSLSDFQAGDPVSVDYTEDDSGKKSARQITRVILEGPPEGFEKFKGFR